MKMYVTSRFTNITPEDVEGLCSAVRAAGMQDFSFIRDVEHYQKMFDTPAEVWQRTRQELVVCDALLIDVSDAPTGGRVLEAGMAYSLEMPVFVIVKAGISYKNIFDGIATQVITYENYGDIVAPLAAYLRSQSAATTS